MTPAQEKAYEAHLAELDHDLEAHLEDWKRNPIVPYVSVIPAEPNHPPSNGAGLNPSVLQQPMN